MKKSGPKRAPAKGQKPEPPRQKSGAQKRRERAERERRAAEADAAARGIGLPGLDDFAQLKPPPLGDPSAAIAWSNDVLLICLGQVVRHPGLTCLERWKWVKDLTAVQGMVRDKAETQKLLKDLREQLRLTRDQSGGTKPLEPGAWVPPEEAGGAPGDRPPDPPTGGTPG